MGYNPVFSKQRPFQRKICAKQLYPLAVLMLGLVTIPLASQFSNKDGNGAVEKN